MDDSETAGVLDPTDVANRKKDAPSFWDDIGHGLDTAYNAVESAGGDLTSLGDRLGKDDPLNIFHIGDSTPAKTDEDKKKDPTSGESTAQTDDEDSAYEALADAQANQYLQDTKAIAPYTSGAAIPSFDTAMTSGAESMLGTSSSSPISQWLNQQVQAAQAQYAPTAAAGATVAQAEQTGEGLVAGGLQQMGQAETAVMQTAPYEGLLTSLAQEVPYHLSEGYSFPGLTNQNVPAPLQSAEKYLGISTTGQGTGVSGTPSLPAPTTNAASTNTLLDPDLPTGGGQT
jgi:hypothetical protein